MNVCVARDIDDELLCDTLAHNLPFYFQTCQQRCSGLLCIRVYGSVGAAAQCDIVCELLLGGISHHFVHCGQSKDVKYS